MNSISTMESHKGFVAVAHMESENDGFPKINLLAWAPFSG